MRPEAPARRFVGQERGQGWRRAGEQEPLPELDPELHEGLELGLALDALGDDRGPDLVREGLERSRHLSPDVARVDVLDELAVELQVVRLEARDLLEPGVAGAHVVYRDLEAEPLELRERLREHVVVLDGVFLGDLEHDAIGGEAQGLELGDEALPLELGIVEGGGEHVDEQLLARGQGRAQDRARRRHLRSSSKARSDSSASAKRRRGA